MPIAVTCGSCSKSFKAPDKFAGKKVKCPGCGTPVTIGAAGGAKKKAAAAAGEAGKISSTCDICSHVFQAPSKFKGKKVKCPSCKNPTVIGGAAKAKAKAPKKDEFDFDDVGSAETCPGCQIRLEPGQIICTNCGFNMKTGKKGVRAEKGEEEASVGEVIMYVGGAILLLAGIAGMVWFFIK